MVLARNKSVQPKAVIAGGGPAGLTAAYELLRAGQAEQAGRAEQAGGIHPVVLEESRDLGGISKTVNYKGNRMDIGGHRFFSKSDAVMQWWENVMPVSEDPAAGSGAKAGDTADCDEKGGGAADGRR